MRVVPLYPQHEREGRLVRSVSSEWITVFFLVDFQGLSLFPRSHCRHWRTSSSAQLFVTGCKACWLWFNMHRSVENDVSKCISFQMARHKKKKKIQPFHGMNDLCARSLLWDQDNKNTNTKHTIDLFKAAFLHSCKLLKEMFHYSATNEVYS